MKSVLSVHGAGSRHMVGDGFPVRNLFPSNGVEAEVNPFLMFDYAGPLTFPPTDEPRGVGEHPHRGFETVTIVYEGVVAHRDSSGGGGVIGPGDVQWMTAAAGLVHEEKHEREFARRGGVLEMAQLWVNLPKAYKMSPPGYQAITAAQIPMAGSAVRVIAGELHGVRGPARTFTPMNVFDVRLRAGERVAFDVPAGHSAALALLAGGVTVNGVAVQGEAQLAVLSREGTRVEIAADAASKLLYLGGEPIDEPVASYGPFVMNTQDEIRQAIDDYRAGRMGKLRA